MILAESKVFTLINLLLISNYGKKSNLIINLRILSTSSTKFIKNEI